MQFLQKLGKSMILPVTCLPVCAIMMGIGYLICPDAIRGGEINGLLEIVGYFLVAAGNVLINNMPILFAIGVGFGLSEENDAIGAFSSLVSYLIIINLLNPEFVSVIFPFLKAESDVLLAFSKVENPFIGILAGIIGSFCYNKFEDLALPEVFQMFSGKRMVPIVTGLLSLASSFVLLFIWPIMFELLVNFGNKIVDCGAIGAGIYGFLNRLLIPVGLHHALNNVFWFDTIGIGDLTQFWQGKTDADVSWSLGMYMSGFFPCMMFGIPGACLAMIQCADSKNKKIVSGLLSSAAICSFISGVTEPFEFAFMFLSPFLYLVYCILYGIIMYVVTLLDFRAGFSFSAGAVDLLFSSSLPAAENTFLIIPIGIATFILFYVTFYVLIKKLDLSSPGRISKRAKRKVEDLAGLFVHGDNYEQQNTQESDENAENKCDEGSLSANLILYLGGKDNIKKLENCMTRLRIEVFDESKVEVDMIKRENIRGVVKPGENMYQIVIGTGVQFVADEMKSLM